MTLLEDYVLIIYKIEIQDKSNGGVDREFIKGIVGKWKRCAESKEHRKDVNLILRKNEEITRAANPETNNRELKINLSSMEATLDDPEIRTEQK